VPGTVIVGTQWGDEGKGKITDLLCERMDVVARYQGGNNAGHTVINGSTELKLHLVPSGILYPRVTPIIGNGCVVDPRVLLQEIDWLEERGISTAKLKVSSNAHLIMPYHLELDQAGERRLGEQQIGTTRRGIGPAYMDKAARLGIRVQDLTDPKILRQKIGVALAEKNALLCFYGAEPLDEATVVTQYLAFAERIAPLVADTSYLIGEALDRGENVLFEGAQGTMLDLDFGTYPFVTSSSPIAGGACVGAGVGPTRIDEVLGIAKAYITRVGSGPFPTELSDDVGRHLFEVGHEVGTTTGRERRCGWFDACVLKYAVQVNGLTGLALTKLDVLSELPSVKLCVEYEHNGKRYDRAPANQTTFHHARPVYEEMPGWREDISQATTFDELPEAAQAYVRRIEELAGVPVVIIAVGPTRSQTIIREDLPRGTAGSRD
jgi:adenylosuccinate synthase